MTPSVPHHKVIPAGGWITAAVVALAAFAFMVAISVYGEAPFPLRVLVCLLMPLGLGCYVLLIAYVYGDARRRGMRYVMWTLLAIFLVNGIGIILYFILRDPLLAYCSRCGSGVQPGYAYCPRCGVNVLPACPACHRVVQPGWSHCAWCGAGFSAPPPTSAPVRP